jgi:hypothetical protein
MGQLTGDQPKPLNVSGLPAPEINRSICSADFGLACRPDSLHRGIQGIQFPSAEPPGLAITTV